MAKTIIIIPVLKIEKQRFRDINLLNQDHTANKRQRQGLDLNPKSELRAQALKSNDEID